MAIAPKINPLAHVARTGSEPGASARPAKLVSAGSRPSRSCISQDRGREHGDAARAVSDQKPACLAYVGYWQRGHGDVFVNLLEPGDRVLIGVNGVFGTRMVDVAQRCGAQVDTVEAEWWTALDPARALAH